jgi:hypothetical protein
LHHVLVELVCRRFVRKRGFDSIRLLGPGWKKAETYRYRQARLYPFVFHINLAYFEADLCPHA